MRGRQFRNGVNDRVDEGGFAGRGSAHHHNIPAPQNSLMDDLDYPCRDGTGSQVLSQGKHPAGLFAQRKRRPRPDNGRKGSLKTRTVQRKFPFHYGVVLIDRQIKATGHQRKNQPALCQWYFPDGFMLLPIPFDPQGTVRVEHDFNHLRVFQCREDKPGAVVPQAGQQARIVTGPHEHQRTAFSTKTATLTRADTATMAASHAVLFLKAFSRAAWSSKTLRMPSTEAEDRLVESCATAVWTPET